MMLFITVVDNVASPVRPCKKRCPRMLSPVCDSKGKTHSSQCEFENMKCDDHLLEIKSTGPCEDHSFFLSLFTLIQSEYYSCNQERRDFFFKVSFINFADKNKNCVI